MIALDDEHGLAGERVKWIFTFFRQPPSPNPNKSLKFRIRRFRNRAKFARCEIAADSSSRQLLEWKRTLASDEWGRFLYKIKQILQNYKVTKWKINLIFSLLASGEEMRNMKWCSWSSFRRFSFLIVLHKSKIVKVSTGNRRVGSTGYPWTCLHLPRSRRVFWKPSTNTLQNLHVIH